MDSLGFVIHLMCKVLNIQPLTSEDILKESGYEERGSAYEGNEY